MVRVKSSDNTVDPTLPNILTFTRGSTQYKNRLK
jgi:hypothetical protein